MNDRIPMLSVVIPVYNVEPYLRRGLDSVLAQSFADMEVICIDDGSTDGCAEILDEYGQIDDRMRVIHKKNGGLVSARKAGAMLANGKYITCVDPDDWIESTMYEEMLPAIESEDADVVTSGCYRDYGTHTVIENEPLEAGVYMGDKLRTHIHERMIDTEMFFKSNLAVHLWQKIYRREFYLQYQLAVDDRISVGEDDACVYPMILNAKKIVVMGKNYYHYCMRSTSMMATRNIEKEKESYTVLLTYLRNQFYKHSEIMTIKKQYQYLALYTMLLRMPEQVISYDGVTLIPYGEISSEERLVIYGAGRFGQVCMDYLENNTDLNIVAWVDRAGNDRTICPEQLTNISYDKILVTVLMGDALKSVEEDLKKAGIQKEKIYTVNEFLHVSKDYVENQLFLDNLIV